MKTSMKQELNHSNECLREQTDTNIIFLQGFNTSNAVRVRVKDNDITQDYRRIIWLVGRHGLKAKAFGELQPALGTYVIAKEKTRFRRGIIRQKMLENQFCVEFIDYGCLGLCKLENLYFANDEIRMLPIYMQTFYLHKVKKYLFTKEMLPFLYTFTHKEYKIKYLSEENKLIELYDIESNEKINDNINALYKELTTMNKSQLKLKRIFETPFKVWTLTPHEQNLTVFVLDISLLQYGLISCIRHSKLERLPHIEQCLNYVARQLSGPYKPKLDELVIVKSENEICCRGVVCRKLNDNIYEVLTYDKVQFQTVNINYIRPYPSFCKFDCYTYFCAINGLPEVLNMKTLEFLTDKIISKNLFIDRVIDIYSDKDIALIECKKLINELRENAFI